MSDSLRPTRTVRVRSNIGFSILATKYKINIRIPTTRITKIIWYTIRSSEFLSVCSPSCVTNLSEEAIRSDAIDSNCFFSINWSIAFVVVVNGDVVVALAC